MEDSITQEHNPFNLKETQYSTDTLETLQTNKITISHLHQQNQLHQQQQFQQQEQQFQDQQQYEYIQTFNDLIEALQKENKSQTKNALKSQIFRDRQKQLQHKLEQENQFIFSTILQFKQSNHLSVDSKILNNTIQEYENYQRLYIQVPSEKKSRGKYKKYEKNEKESQEYKKQRQENKKKAALKSRNLKKQKMQNLKTLNSNLKSLKNLLIQQKFEENQEKEFHILENEEVNQDYSLDFQSIDNNPNNSTVYNCSSYNNFEISDMLDINFQDL